MENSNLKSQFLEKEMSFLEPRAASTSRSTLGQIFQGRENTEIFKKQVEDLQKEIESFRQKVAEEEKEQGLEIDRLWGKIRVLENEEILSKELLQQSERRVQISEEQYRISHTREESMERELSRLRTENDCLKTRVQYLEDDYFKVERENDLLRTRLKYLDDENCGVYRDNDRLVTEIKLLETQKKNADIELAKNKTLMVTVSKKLEDIMTLEVKKPILKKIVYESVDSETESEEEDDGSEEEDEESYTQSSTDTLGRSKSYWKMAIQFMSAISKTSSPIPKGIYRNILFTLDRNYNPKSDRQTFEEDVIFKIRDGGFEIDEMKKALDILQKHVGKFEILKVQKTALYWCRATDALLNLYLERGLKGSETFFRAVCKELDVYTTTKNTEDQLVKKIIKSILYGKFRADKIGNVGQMMCDYHF